MEKNEEGFLIDLEKEFKTDTPYPLDFVLPGFLAGSVGALVSPGGMGKTMFAMELAVAVASGYDILSFEKMVSGWKFKPSAVTYLSAEDSPEILVNRLKAIADYLGKKEKKLMIKNLKVGSLIAHPHDIGTTEGRNILRSAAESSRLVILDTFRRFQNGDENSSKEMTHALQIIEQICSETRCAVLILHHTSKAGAQEFGDSAQAIRGSSVLTDNMRFQMNLVGVDPKRIPKAVNLSSSTRSQFVQLVFTKLNYTNYLSGQWYFRDNDGVLISTTSYPEELNSFNSTLTSDEHEHTKSDRNEQDNYDKIAERLGGASTNRHIADADW